MFQWLSYNLDPRLRHSGKSLAGPSGGYLRLLAGCRLPSGKQARILTYFQTKVNKKKAKKALFCSS